MSQIKKKLDIDVLYYYLHSIFASLDFSRGIFVIYLLDKDISIAQVGILQTVLFWGNLAAEVPAGIIADKSKRKYSVVFGLVMLALSAVGFLYFESFLGYLVVFVMLGVGFAFQSGANVALLYDNLKLKGKELSDKYVSILAHSRTLGTLGMAFAIYAGGELKEFGWNWVFIPFAVAMIISALLILKIKEPKIHSHDQDDEAPLPIVQSLKIFMKAKEGKKLLYFIFGMGFLEATAAPFFIYIQKLLSDYEVSTAQIGLIIAASQLTTAGVYQFTSYFEKWSLQRQVKVFSLVLVILIVPFYFQPPVAIIAILFLLIEAIPSLLFVFTDHHINENTPSHIRASVLSVQSFVSAVFISMSFLCCGFLIEKFSSHVILSSLAILPIIGLLLLAKYISDPLKNIEGTNE